MPHNLTTFAAGDAALLPLHSSRSQNIVRKPGVGERLPSETGKAEPAVTDSSRGAIRPELAEPA